MQKGAIKLVSKKDVVDSPDYFDMQNLDPVAEGLWQFFQHDDAMDNAKLDKLQKLLVAVKKMDVIVDFHPKISYNLHLANKI